jgi:hypothetical protein
LVTIEKFEANHVLVNINKLKPYKYMESEIQKHEQHMLVYWEQSANGLQEDDSNMDVENEDNVKQQP